MFTGLIEEVGEVQSIGPGKNSVLQLRIEAADITSKLRPGDSVAVNGCCLTATATRRGQVTFDLLQETMARTNFRTVRAGDLVNLERALASRDRLGGHFVQGHVDCTAPVIGFDCHGVDYRLEVELASAFSHYAAFKGSVALNGISLTIAELLPHSMIVWIIPHTRQQTNLALLRTGDLLNVEFDILAKYVERMLPRFLPETESKSPARLPGRRKSARATKANQRRGRRIVR